MFNILYNSYYIKSNKTDIHKIYDVKFNGIIDIGYWYNDSTIIDDELLIKSINKKYKYIYLFINDIEYLYDISKKTYNTYNYNNKNMTNIFYFIDNGHITGINIPAPIIAHFLVTTNEAS